ncbi:MAG: hypothetical protein K6E70_07335 [Butyrivibrio sp.]|nr:hypothetical protein [Butyrivibrio sp.]
MTTKIKFSYSILDWVSTMLLAYMAYMVIFCLECALATFAGYIIPDGNIWFKIARLFFANGFLIPICSIALSLIFEKIVESYNLDYFEYYSAKVAQICYAAFSIAFFVCILNNLPAITKGTNIDETTEFMISRLIVWILTAAGTWLGFGFKCEGRIAKENKKREKISEGKSDAELKTIRKKKWYFWSRVLSSLLGCCVIVSLITNKMMEVFWIYFAGAAVIFVLVGLITLSIFQFFTNPSEERSNKILLDNINLYKRKEGKEEIKGQYGRMRYRMLNGKMEIDAVNVVYPGHEHEVNELFGAKEYVLDNMEEIITKMRLRNEKQKEYIAKGFKDCILKQKESLLKKVG